MNFTLSVFDVRDLGINNVSYLQPHVSSCRYYDFRHPPDHPNRWGSLFSSFHLKPVSFNLKGLFIWYNYKTSIFMCWFFDNHEKNLDFIIFQVCCARGILANLSCQTCFCCSFSKCCRIISDSYKVITQKDINWSFKLKCCLWSSGFGKKRHF